MENCLGGGRGFAAGEMARPGNAQGSRSDHAGGQGRQQRQKAAGRGPPNWRPRQRCYVSLLHEREPQPEVTACGHFGAGSPPDCAGGDRPGDRVHSRTQGSASRRKAGIRGERAAAVGAERTRADPGRTAAWSTACRKCRAAVRRGRRAGEEVSSLPRHSTAPRRTIPAFHVDGSASDALVPADL